MIAFATAALQLMDETIDAAHDLSPMLEPRREVD